MKLKAMAQSLESLFMFVEAAALGSFSAAARKLGKQQSTVSEAIANLEIDLGLTLFDRATRRPTLTEQGKAMLIHAQHVLDASDRLTRSAHSLADGLEPALTLVLSDTYQSNRFEAVLTEFEQRYPELELECMIAEHTDVIALVQQGRAQLGLVGAQPDYPPDIGFEALAEPSELGLYVGKRHRLATATHVTMEMLLAARELRISTYGDASVERRRGRCWSASSYLLLLEMTELGFGWAELPRWLVQRFAADGLLELQARGWPKTVQVDAVWSRRHGLGKAGGWLLDTLLAP
jgi:DNA-binding transcriptional LysR family regulator